MELILSILISILLTSCTNDIEMYEDEDKALHTVTMTLNGSFVDFDDISTRASSKEWENGNTLFLEFYTSKGNVYGKAVYNENTNGEWIVSYYGTLDKNSEMKVNATFFDDPSLKFEQDVVTLSPTTAMYWTEEFGKAVYSSSNELSITITIKPGGSRIRFKGIPGDNIAVGGINFSECFYPDSFTYDYSEDFAYLTVNESGYTDYLYDYNEIIRTKQIKINKQEEDGWDYLYTMDCTEDMLAMGKSGWLNIPTPTKRNGWAMKQVSGEENGHMWVDLGLPSGTLWADENVGADIAQWQEDENESNVFGEFYHWGQTPSRTGCLGNDDIQGSTTYDTAKALWKGSWVIPSKADYEELLDFCTIMNMENVYESISAVIICGSTGESMAMPYRATSSRLRNYWTSTPSEDTEESFLHSGEWVLTTLKNAWAFYISKSGSVDISTTTRYWPDVNSQLLDPYEDGLVRAVIK